MVEDVVESLKICGLVINSVVPLMIILHGQSFCKEIQFSSTSVITWYYSAVIMHSEIHSTVEE